MRRFLLVQLAAITFLSITSTTRANDWDLIGGDAPEVAAVDSFAAMTIKPRDALWPEPAKPCDGCECSQCSADNPEESCGCWKAGVCKIKGCDGTVDTCGDYCHGAPCETSWDIGQAEPAAYQFVGLKRRYHCEGGACSEVQTVETVTESQESCGACSAGDELPVRIKGDGPLKKLGRALFKGRRGGKCCG